MPYKYIKMLNTRHRSTVLFISLAAFFLYFQLFRFSATPILFEGDHAVHLSNAWRMYLGEIPFRDFFLFTFPGTELYYLFLFKLFGVKIWILNATIFFLMISLSAVGLYFSRRLLKGWAVYLPVAIFLVVGFRPLGIDGSHRFFSVLAVLIAVAVIFSRRTSSRLFLSGILCGLASCFTQPRGLVGLAAIVFFLAFETYSAKQSLSSFIRMAFWTVLPFALIVGLTSFYFIFSAGFDTFYFSTFIFPVKHYPADVWNNTGAFLRDVPAFRDTSFPAYLKQAAPILFNYFLIPWIYLLFFALLWFKRETISIDKKFQLILLNLTGLFLAVGVFSAPTSTRFYQISLPALISLIWIFQYLFNLPRVYLSFLIILGLLGFSYTIQRQTNPVYALNTPSGFTVSLTPEILARYSWVAEHTQPFDYFYEPHHPSLYWIFHLKNPTPLPLIRPNNYTSIEQVDAIMKGLEQNPPRYVIWNGVWEKYDAAQSPNFHLEPLVNFLHTNYHQVSKLHNFNDNNNETEYEIEIWEKN